MIIIKVNYSEIITSYSSIAINHIIKKKLTIKLKRSIM